jgi:hypothetical protein
VTIPYITKYVDFYDVELNISGTASQNNTTVATMATIPLNGINLYINPNTDGYKNVLNRAAGSIYAPRQLIGSR